MLFVQLDLSPLSLGFIGCHFWLSSVDFLSLLYYLHLKESVLRFNHRGESMCQLLLKIIKKYPLNTSREPSLKSWTMNSV